MNQAQALYADTFRDIGALALAIARADAGGTIDPRLIVSGPLGNNERVPSEGGFAVPDTLAAELWSTVYAQGELLGRCARLPLTNGKLKLPTTDETSRANGSRFGGARVYWADEAATVPVSPLRFRQMTLEAKKLLALVYTSDELLRDAAALGAWLERLFALEATFTVEDQIVNGSGAGRPLGILNAGATITVDPESGQVAGTFVLANARVMLSRSWIGSRRSLARLVHPDLEADLGALQLENGGSAFTYGPDGVARLLGKPVIPTEYCAPRGSRGDVILADLSQYLIGEQEPDLLSSLHVNFLSNESVFRFRWRLDGQPAWASPVTPKDGGATQSPFVTLAART